MPLLLAKFRWLRVPIAGTRFWQDYPTSNSDENGSSYVCVNATSNAF